MSLRRRLMLMATVAVGASVLVACAITWFEMGSQLRGEVDEALFAQARVPPGPTPGGGPARAGRRPGLQLPGAPPGEGGRSDYAQRVTAAGAVFVREGDESPLRVTDADLAVARGERDRVLDTRDHSGEQLRVLTTRTAVPGAAVMIARSLEPTNRVLGRMALVLLVICAGATIVAAIAVRLLARRVLAPVAGLTEAAEHIEATGDLSRRVPESGDDEVGRLAARFNAMLGRLGESVAAQRQLVADASHELRTPVTALRTNAEVLSSARDMGAEQRRAVLDDIVAQTEELTEIVADVIELARGDAASGQPVDSLQVEPLRFDELVAESVRRAERHSPDTRFSTALDEVVVVGDRQRLARAVNNLLDNAAKHGGDTAVDVVLGGDGRLTIRDRGPGVPEAELGRVFERFYRGAAARAHHGSGLGLAIVDQIARAHGGKVSIANAADGPGAVAVLELPV